MKVHKIGCGEALKSYCITEAFHPRRRDLRFSCVVGFNWTVFLDGVSMCFTDARRLACWSLVRTAGFHSLTACEHSHINTHRQFCTTLVLLRHTFFFTLGSHATMLLANYLTSNPYYSEHREETISIVETIVFLEPHWQKRQKSVSS